jgi:hypothetical protein
MGKAEAKDKGIKNGTKGDNFIYRTVEAVKDLGKGRLEVTGACGHIKVVRVERKKGDLFRCLACSGGTNVGGTPAAPKAVKAPKAKAKKNGKAARPATATAGK